MSSYDKHLQDEITVDDDKRDATQVHEEGLTQTKSWEQVKAEAERDEEWQHSLSFLQSLKINRAVSPPQLTRAQVSPADLSRRSSGRSLLQDVSSWSPTTHSYSDPSLVCQRSRSILATTTAARLGTRFLLVGKPGCSR